MMFQKTARWLFVLLLLFMFISPVVERPVSVDAHSSWWSLDWSYRRLLTINNSTVAETLTNVPVLVKLDNTRINYSQTKAGGADVRFIASDNATLLSYEIETWDATGTSWVWVKIPTITASTTTTFYMYWGNSGALDAQKVTDVWSNGYVMVQHLDDTTTSTTTDSLGVNNGTKLGANEPVQAAGKVGFGQSFDGVDDQISFGLDSSLNQPTVLTIEMLANITALVASQALINTRESPSVAAQHFQWSEIGGDFRFDRGDGALNDTTIMNPAPATGQWVYLASVDDNTDLRFYYNGALQSVPTVNTITPAALAFPVKIGRARAADPKWAFAGSMDEVRISSVPRSANWLKAQNLSMTDTYISYGSQATKPGSVSAGWLSSYSYRARIPLTGTTAIGAAEKYRIVDLLVYYGIGTNTTGTVYLNNHTDNVFNGVRFTAQDGTTLLDSYKHNVTLGVSARFDVAIPNGETAVYIYYDTGKSTQSYSLQHGMWGAGAISDLNSRTAIRYSGTYDRTYLPYLALDSSIWITAFDHTSQSWLAPKKIANATLNDNHFTPGFDVTQSGANAGYGHIIFGGHASTAAKYYRAFLDVVWSSLTFTDKTAAINSAYTTYPAVRVDGTGRIWWVYRGATLEGAPGVDFNNYFASLQYSDDNGDTWTVENKFISASASNWVYIGSAVDVNAAGDLHVAWYLYVEGGNILEDVYYAYRSRADGNWYDIAGANLGIQITLNEGATRVYDGGNADAHLNMYLGLDSTDSPLITYGQGVFDTDYDAKFASWNGAGWDIVNIVTTFYGGQSAEFYVTSDTQVDVYLNELVGDAREIRHYRGTKAGGVWAFAFVENITSNSPEGTLDASNEWSKVVRNANLSDVAVVWNYSPTGTPSTVRAYPEDISVTDFDSLNPAWNFLDRFDRTGLSNYYIAGISRYGIWETYTAGGATTPSLASNALVSTVAGGQVQSLWSKENYTFYDGFRFRTTVEKSSWGANANVALGVWQNTGGWLNQNTVSPNNGLVLKYTNATTATLYAYVGGVETSLGAQTVGSGNNQVDITYNLNTGAVVGRVDSVTEWSAVQAGIAAQQAFLLGAYTTASTTNYPEVLLGESATGPGWGDVSTQEPPPLISHSTGATLLREILTALMAIAVIVSAIRLSSNWLQLLVYAVIGLLGVAMMRIILFA